MENSPFFSRRPPESSASEDSSRNEVVSDLTRRIEFKRPNSPSRWPTVSIYFASIVFGGFVGSLIGIDRDQVNALNSQEPDAEENQNDKSTLPNPGQSPAPGQDQLDLAAVEVGAGLRLEIIPEQVREREANPRKELFARVRGLSRVAGEEDSFKALQKRVASGAADKIEVHVFLAAIRFPLNPEYIKMETLKTLEIANPYHRARLDAYDEVFRPAYEATLLSFKERQEYSKLVEKDRHYRYLREDLMQASEHSDPYVRLAYADSMEAELRLVRDVPNPLTDQEREKLNEFREKVGYSNPN